MTEPAFFLLGTGVTWLELAAFALALGCVVCNIREIHWGWPLAIGSSALYGWLFFGHRLYGEAWLQVFFAVVSGWGWWQWLRGTRAAPPVEGGAAGRVALGIASLGAARTGVALAGWVLAWLALGGVLGRFTDTDVPFLDAFPTAGSVLGQLLLGRKYVENWPVWVGVNVASVALFASKGLWLTALLYLVFTALSLVGWRSWRARLEAAACPAPLPEAAR